jgi:hypothetical protein
LYLQREDVVEAVANADKASVNFHTDHSRGSLGKSIDENCEGGINSEASCKAFRSLVVISNTAFMQIWNLNRRSNLIK